MKKFYLILVLAAFGSHLWATEIVYTYHFNKAEVQKSRSYDIVTFDQTMLTNRVGEPLLPYRAISLLLPPGEFATSIQVIREGKTAIEGSFLLLPAQASKPLSEDKPLPFAFNELIYNSSEAYPADSHGQLTTEYLNGFGFAFSTVTPIEYIPSEGKLFYYSKITVKITTSATAKSAEALTMLKTTEKVLQTVEKLAHNSEYLSHYPKKAASVTDFEFLIITPQSYVDGFDPLVAMYLAKGNRSQVVTTEYINANITGPDLQAKIRNFIILKYLNNQIGTVILGGDAELVPYRGFYCTVQSGSGYTDNGIPADLYYAGLNGTWNTNNNDKWGEPDESDLLPEIGIGRLPFSNATEQNNLINKSVKYQTQPVLGEFTKPLLVGENLYSGPDTWGKDYLELLIGLRTDNGYTTNGIPATYNIQRMYEFDGNWSASTLRNAINQGTQYVHHVGHASQTYVAKMSNPDITNANFPQTNGVIKNYSIFHTHGCDCGAFDYNDCILERMVNIENFAVAVIGNSRFGWFNEGQTEGPSAHLHREMTDAIFNDKISALGAALSQSKAMTAPWVTAPGQWEEGALRWNFYDLNILGDPALDVWSAEPIQTQVDFTSELVLGTTSTSATVTVNGLPFSNAVCSILMNGELIARALTQENGVAELFFDTPVTEIGTATLIVSGNNAFTQSYPLTFIPASGPYVVYAEHSIDDSMNGNGNGLPDNNELFQLQVGMKNVGMEASGNLTVTISSENGDVSFPNNTFTINNIAPGDTIIGNPSVEMQLADGIPNQQTIYLDLTATNGTTTWYSGFSIQVLAPELLIGNYSINDATGGNNNGLLDPGETVQLMLTVSNTGSSIAYDALASLVCNNPWITIVNPNITIGEIGNGSSQNIAFTVVVNPNTPFGTVAGFDLAVAAGAYTKNLEMLLSVGLRIEDFESGDFNAYEWHHGGSADWTVTTANPYEGIYSSRSGAIANNTTSDLWLSLIVMANDNVKFARKVSSEANYDFLNFYIDDVRVGQWSGELGWEEVSFPINEGSHALRWSYQKDVSVNSGSDCAFIDKITFPGTTTMIDVNEQLSPLSFSILPNPNNGHFYILTNQPKSVGIKIYNNMGKLILTKDQLLESQPIDGSSLSKGMYIIEIFDGNQSFRNKMIVQ